MAIMKIKDPTWLSCLRRYLLFVFVTNLMWETLQLPLYTLWTEGTFTEQVFAIVHCTGGDVLIALACLTTALVVLGDKAWPARHFQRVAVLAITLGVAYTVFSEWLNLEVRRSWAYSGLMPVLPPFGTGLSPLLQWLIIPTLGLWWARRRSSSQSHKPNDVDPDSKRDL